MNDLFRYSISSKILVFLMLSSVITISRADGLEIDIDRLGMDYRYIVLPAADPLLCQTECAGDAECKSFTYVKPGLHGPGAVCYLKNGEPSPTPNNCCISGLRPEKGGAQQCQFGPDTCLQGFVWREASPQDHVCVPGDTRAQAALDNSQADARRDPQGAWGLTSCIQGFVWREAFPNDHVCVPGDTRAQAALDNSQADARRDRSCSITVPSDARLHIDAPIDVGSVPPRPSYTVPQIQPDGTVVGVSRDPLAGEPSKMWNPGQTIRVRMEGGTAGLHSRVRQYALEWTQHAYIRFEFVDPAQPAEIRVSFEPNGTSWSTVGRDSLGVPFNGITMNFGWFDDNTPDADVRRTTLHEFGHALGLIHEHQSPAAGIPWDKEKVYAFFKTTQNPGWEPAKVDQNVFARYNASTTNYSQFDQNSIMAYSFPASLTLNGVGIAGGATLSPIDIQYIRRWYPRPGDQLGQLRTGDDCDEIEFNVEYGVAPPDKVAFALRLGANVTWWKAIQVPTGGAGYTDLAIGSTTEQEIARADLDNARPIRFHKAKFLGVHTMLGYTWDVISALPGGSRVTLAWVRDRCGG